ncbi:MAG TPA: methyltransferase domain-containing protein [Anaeromyxobacteraceae bacterium]|nr:methyltransferase domain-containing protein [Anaeromyxobacteraceae bacterium]
MAETSRYIHGTDPAEQARLSTLNDLLNAACVREIALSGGERVLDVGAGLGQLTRALARAAGRAAVGIERSPAQLEAARRLAREAGEERLAELREGDALAFPIAGGEWGTFDVAHARFLLEHVPEPAAVVAQMVRAVRPGGRVVLCDDDHSLMRLHPEPPGFRAAWDAFVRSYDRHGNDPYVGRRLPALLAAAGATPRRATWIFFGACAGEAAFPAFAANVAANLSGARAAIAETGMVREDEVDRAVEALDAFARRADAVIWYAMPWAEGVVTAPPEHGRSPRA